MGHRAALRSARDQDEYSAKLSSPLLSTCGNPNTQALSTHRRYAVYIDAGSSGSRIHVFEFETMSGHDVLLDPRTAYARPVLPEPTLSVEPGLSHFSNDPAGAGRSLRPLLEYALKQVRCKVMHLNLGQWQLVTMHSSRWVTRSSARQSNDRL